MPQKDYLPLIFRRCVLAILGARLPSDVTLTKGMLEQLVLLAEQYLSSLTEHLNRLSNMQRRQKSSIDDLALLMFLHELNITDIEFEAKVYTPQMEESRSVNSLNSLYFDPEEAPIEAGSLPFFEQFKQLVPSSRQRPQSIPEWMPPLPPNHTYMHTPSHSSTVRDLRHVRLRLVDEGSLAERALQRMLGDNGSASVIELKKPKAVLGSAPGEWNNGTQTGAASSTVTAISNLLDIKPEVTLLNPSRSQTPEAPEPLEPTPKLKFKIHLPQPESETPRLKLSLSKSKKKKETSILGKRPKIDIVELAKNGKQKKEDRMDEERDAFQVALQSVR